MARPERRDADYFPFICKDGKTLYILEGKYGCKGTGFFTNVMRYLTMETDHHLCLKDETARAYFFSKAKCDEESAMDMLNLMAMTGKIDRELWEKHRVIVSPDLLISLADAYRTRKNKIITVEQIKCNFASNPVSSAGNRDSVVGNGGLCLESDEIIPKGKDSKVKKAGIEFPAPVYNSGSVASLKSKTEEPPGDENPPFPGTEQAKEPDTLLADLKSVLEEIGAIMPDKKKQRDVMLFIEANVKRKNHRAMMHCLRSMLKQLKDGNLIDLPKLYLDAALKIEEGKHNARDHDREAKAEAFQRGDLSKLGNMAALTQIAKAGV